MLTRLRNWAKSPAGQYAIAGGAISYGARRLVELTRASRADLDELVELHADTRTRVFTLETIEEGRRALAPVLNEEALRQRLEERDGPDQSIDQATEEVQQ
jgi:hypothetical protein